MNTYHKIQTVYKRDPETNFKTLLPEYSLPEFKYLTNNKWQFTEKVDGMNIRVMWDGEQVSFSGKSDKTEIPSLLLKRLYQMFVRGKEKGIYIPHKKLKEIFGTEGSVCLYGEGCGAKIQAGGENYCTGQNFVLFDIKIGTLWLQRKDVEEIAGKLVLDVVPVIGEGTLADMVKLIGNEFTSTWGDFQAEGIVARPMVELFARNGQRIITKLKCKDFR